jgi:1,4-dihydroxy-6-naphthoate synthase
MNITLGHSPDPDDAFMFYAIAEHKIDTRGYNFTHILQDIQTLNERARNVDLDVTAVSIHAYTHITKDYALISCGASMGDNYGPMLVGKKKYDRETLKGKKIAVPGKQTSAYLALHLYLNAKEGDLDTIVVPFDQIFDALDAGKADVGLIIHEGQITYKDHCFVLSEDLGVWWYKETNGLPLPLGGNVVKKSLGLKVMRELSEILYESIKYGLEHRSAGVDHSLPLGRGLDKARTDKFIGMYVNELTLSYGERGRAGIIEFLKRGHEIGMIPKTEVEFV